MRSRWLEDEAASTSSSIHILEANTHQFGKCRNHSGGNNHAGNKVIGQFGSQFTVSELVRIDAGGEQCSRLFPARVVACKKHGTAPYHRWDGAIRRRVDTGLILEIRGIVRSRFCVFDQRIGFELLAGQARELIFVPRRLIIERKLRRTMVANTARMIGPHWMIIWPYDAKRCGLPNTVRDAGAWVMFDGTPYAYLHICGTPWVGNEYGPGQVPIWTMRYGRQL